MLHMSVEASPGVLDVAINGVVPIHGTVAPEAFDEVVDIYKHQAPIKSPKDSLYLFAVSGSLGQIQEVLDAENLDQLSPGTETYKGVSLSTGCVAYGGLKMFRAMRPMLEIVADIPDISADSPCLFDGMVLGNYTRTASIAKLWHIDALVPKIREEHQREFLCGYPNGVRTYTGSEIDTSGYIDQFGALPLDVAIKQLHSSVKDSIQPEDTITLGPGQVGEIDKFVLHSAPASAGFHGTRPAFRLCI